MQAYTGFAQVYDMFMDNIPYAMWNKYLVELLNKFGVSQGLILDLGCGTGNITEQLAISGYDMIGIDISEEMLSLAIEKRNEYIHKNGNEDKRSNILYLNQDMREFELYGTVAAIVSICDSMNYIMSEEELLEVFQLANNYLDPEGIFIFDLNTEYKYKTLLADNTIAENREDSSFIWDNYYYEDEMVNEYNLTIYKQCESDTYKRYDETHYQKAYPLETIKKLIQEAGMEFVAAYDAFSNNEPTNTSERIYIVAREKHQSEKMYC